MPTHSLYLSNFKLASVSLTGTLDGQSQIVSNLISIPSAPIILGTLTNDSIILVVFKPYDFNETAIITDYQYSIDGGITFVTMEYIFTVTTNLAYIIQNLTNGINYQVQVKALNANGEGTASNIVSEAPSTKPSDALIYSVTGGSGIVSINFSLMNDGGSAITNYKYSVDNGVTFTAFSPAQTTNPLIITGLDNNNITYDIVIKAVNTKGDGLPSNSKSITLMPAYYYLINQYSTSIWLDTTQASNFVLSGSNVTTWYDKTGHNFNLTNVGTITYNSTSPTCVSIPANSCFKQTITPYYNMTTPLQTWFCVLSFPNALTSNDFISLLSLYNSTLAGGYNTTIYYNKLTINNHGTANGIHFNVSVNTTTTYLLTISLNTSTNFSNANANTIIRLNGTTQSTYVSGTVTDTYTMSGTSSVSIGGGNYISPYFSTKPFKIYEMIGIGNQALGINDIRTIESYLNTKWGLGYTIA